MKTSDVLKKLFTGACVYYSVLSLAFILIGVLLRGNLSGTVIGTLNILLLFPFAFALSSARFLRLHSGLSELSRILLHFLICVVAFYLFVFLPSRASAGPMGHLMAIILSAAVYWLAYLICHFTGKRFHNFKEE